MLFDVCGESKFIAIREDTWGHLRPAPRQTYPGHVVFAIGAFGDIVILEADFEGLPNSPWFFDDVNAYVDEQVDKVGSGERGIWRFEGTYTRFKNQKCRFSGKVEKQELAPARRSPNRDRYDEVAANRHRAA